MRLGYKDMIKSGAFSSKSASLEGIVWDCSYTYEDRFSKIGDGKLEDLSAVLHYISMNQILNNFTLVDSKGVFKLEHCN